MKRLAQTDFAAKVRAEEATPQETPLKEDLRVLLE